MSRIDFWKNCSAEVDLAKSRTASVTVKGECFRDPGRCLELFGNMSRRPDLLRSALNRPLPGFHEVCEFFLPRVCGKRIPFGPGIEQPPFTWGDCNPQALVVNFTYNTNAIYRILNNLNKQGLIGSSHLDGLMDKACLLLSYIYQQGDAYVLKHLNNNINMYLISRVVEELVGKAVYDVDRQEPQLTRVSLGHTLKSLGAYLSNSVTEYMALALGRGVAFQEQAFSTGRLEGSEPATVKARTSHYTEEKLAVDDRQHLIDRVLEANDEGHDIRMCAILDDTSETVFDLLWIQELMKSYRHFHVELLLNRLQVSINFSSDMMATIIENEHFSELRRRQGSQLLIRHIFCPLISFQSNLLTRTAHNALRAADFVYVKGLNFFETCQIESKDRYHAFVVLGPISQLYTGLQDYDGVFVHIPSGVMGYTHHRDSTRIRPLVGVCTSRPSHPAPRVGLGVGTSQVEDLGMPRRVQS
ncbi:MAG TPA: hypothetical protein VHA33_14385 [Candidatus Angelobacter sp.]|jgi:hypothetical protein|nr:hypothetical protein [Candidatus Angelobacter sp.]